MNRTLRTIIPACRAVRAIRTLSTPNQVFTKLSDTKDPQRSPFFQYTWGSWLKDDAAKKARRETKFSIEGVTKMVNELAKRRTDTKNIDKKGEFVVKPVEQLEDGTYVLNNNLDLVGAETGPIKSIASIHEGKHHRIYQIELSSGKKLVLRIPYRLESMAAIANKIRSEVATMDFLHLKLGANVPRVISYGVDKINHANTPFILMEHIEGDLLMKKWDPLEEDGDKTVSNLSAVIDPIADFQEQLLSVEFNKFGSLYFKDDAPATEADVVPYEGETNPVLANRWRIGPSVEKVYSKYKNQLSDKVVMRLNGPWSKEEANELVVSVAEIESENTRNRLALAQADAGHIEDIPLLKRQLAAWEKFGKVAPVMLNSKSKSIVNVDRLFAPRLFVPDLDPLNVVVRDGKAFFVDFEYTTIKPFILSSYPAFVAYQGAKVYNIEEEIPEFSELGELEQQQYRFMYHKTRNERLWEVALNKRRHDLIAVASPYIKQLKSAYLQALEMRDDRDYLYVEGSLMNLGSIWDVLVQNELVGTTKEFPVEYTEEEVKAYKEELEKYEHETVSNPFAATGGWVPQDMFERLVEQGILVRRGEDYEVDKDRLLSSEELSSEELSSEANK